MCRNLLNVIWRLNGLQRRQVQDLLKPTIPSLANRQDNIDEDDDIPFKCLSKHFRLHKINFVEKRGNFLSLFLFPVRKFRRRTTEKKMRFLFLLKFYLVMMTKLLRLLLPQQSCCCVLIVLHFNLLKVRFLVTHIMSSTHPSIRNEGGAFGVQSASKAIRSRLSLNFKKNQRNKFLNNNKNSWRHLMSICQVFANYFCKEHVIKRKKCFQHNFSPKKNPKRKCHKFLFCTINEKKFGN